MDFVPTCFPLQCELRAPRRDVLLLPDKLRPAKRTDSSYEEEEFDAEQEERDATDNTQTDQRSNKTFSIDGKHRITQWTRKRHEVLSRRAKCLAMTVQHLCLADRQQHNHFSDRQGYTAKCSIDRNLFEKSVAVSPDAYSSPDYMKQLFSSRTPNDCTCTQLTALNTGKSATGPIHILMVHKFGEFIRLVNKSRLDFELGHHYIFQLNIAGKIVAKFRLPARLSVPPLGVVTVWAATSSRRLDQLPSDFICATVPAWWPDSSYTTVVSNPSGQAVAWTTTATLPMPGDNKHHSADNEDSNVFWSVSEMRGPVVDLSDELVNKTDMRLAPPGDQQHPWFPCRYRAPREQRSQHSTSAVWRRPGSPGTCLNQTGRRQIPIPELPSSGAPGQRMGSAKLRLHVNGMRTAARTHPTQSGNIPPSVASVFH